MDDLIAELNGDQRTGGRGCTFCQWLETRPEAEREPWRQAMLDREYTRASLVRAAKRRGYPHGDSSVDQHREHVRNDVATKAVRVAGRKSAAA